MSSPKKERKRAVALTFLQEEEIALLPAPGIPNGLVQVLLLHLSHALLQL